MGKAWVLVRHYGKQESLVAVALQVVGGVYRGQWGSAGCHLRSWSLSDQDSSPPSEAHLVNPIEAFDQLSGHCLIASSSSAT